MRATTLVIPRDSVDESACGYRDLLRPLIAVATAVTLGAMVAIGILIRYID